MELNLRVLKKEILEKAVSYTNHKFGLHLEIQDFRKDAKFGHAIISGNELKPENASKIGMILSERIQLLTNHRWGKI